jgi:chromosome segregation ATPase
MLHIRINGIETGDLEATNKIADIIGNCPQDQLIAEAKKDINSFFFMLKYIWAQTDIIHFYNDHFNSHIQDLKDQNTDDTRQINDLITKCRNLEATVKNMTENMDVIRRSRDEYREQRNKLDNDNYELNQENIKLRELLASNEIEILRLKAKMFDLTDK